MITETEKALQINARLLLCRGERIRTSGLVVPNDARYRAALHPAIAGGKINIFLLFRKLILQSVNYGCELFLCLFARDNPNKLDWSIFRLGAIMGGHKISKLMFHQPLKTSFEIVTAEDTGRAFVNAIENRDFLSKKIFNLGGGESCRTIYDKFLIRSFKIAGLGSFNFPLKTFAEKNFHCGYYEDGNKLENILHFRKDNLESYFEKKKNKIKGLKKLFVLVFKEQIKKYLLRQSEPYQAFRTNNKKMMELYFD